MEQQKKRNILLLDFAQETNSGDAAMQMSIIMLAKKHFPDASLSVISVFGANQFPEALSQYRYTSGEERLQITGGLYPTFENFHAQHTSSLFEKLIKMVTGSTMMAFGFFFFLFPRTSFWKKVFSKYFRETFDTINNTDFVIWNGRNFRGSGFWREPYKLFGLFLHPLVCLSLKKPVVCVGASIWEMKNPISRMMARFIFTRCLFVSVRESYSYEVMQKLLRGKGLGAKVVVLPDLSFPILGQYASLIQKDLHTGKNVVGITLVGRRELGSQTVEEMYVASLQKLTRRLLDKGFLITVIPQVTFGPEEYRDIVDHIFGREGNRHQHVSVLERSLSMKELLETYARMEFLIASRMHSAIFALFVDTPVLAIPYDTGNKWGILEDMGIPRKYIIPASELISVDIQMIFDHAWNERRHIAQNTQNILSAGRIERAEEHIKLARSEFDAYVEKKTNTSAKKISFLLPSFRGGGAEKVFITLANACVARGRVVELVVLNSDGPYKKTVDERISVVDLSSKRAIFALPYLVRYISKNHPGVIISAMPHMNVLVLLARMISQKDISVIVTEHNPYSVEQKRVSWGKRIITKWCAHFLYPKAKAIVAVSNGVAEDLASSLRISRGGISVVWNPFDIPMIQTNATESVEHPWVVRKQKPLILAAGRLVPQKDFSTLLRAFALLRKKVDAKLILLGEGPLFLELKSIAESLLIHDDVDFYGFSDNPFPFMKSADVYVLSSQFEGFGNVLVEAMACGTHVVSTDCPSGPREILDNGTYGRLVPMGDPDSLAKGIEQAILHPFPSSETLVKRAHDFSLEKSLSRYLDLINE